MNIKILTIFFFIINYYSFSQNKAVINKTTELSCDCIKEISSQLNQREKSEGIKKCITSSSTVAQLLVESEKMLNSENNSNIENRTDTINLDKTIILNPDKFYTEVEDKLLKECTELYNIYFSDDQKSSKYSNSENKEALKFYDLGQTNFKQQKFKKAIKNFKKAIAIDSNFAFAYDNIGYAYRKLSDFDNAIVNYKKSLAIDPKGKMPLMNIAVAYSLNNQIDEAKKAYKNYRSHYKDDPESFYGLGTIQFYEKDFKPALENMIQAYFLYQDLGSPYYKDAKKHIAWIYEEYKKLDNLDEFRTIANRFNLNFEK